MVWMIISLRVCPGTVLFTDKDTAQDIGRYFNRAIAWISVIKTLCAILIPCAMVRVKTLNYSSVSFKRRSNSVVTLFGKWYVYDSVAKCTYSMFSLSTAKIASGFDQCRSEQACHSTAWFEVSVELQIFLQFKMCALTPNDPATGREDYTLSW